MYLYSQRSPANLGALSFRPNQAVQRSLYGMGDAINVPVDPTLLIAGAGLLTLAALLFTGKKIGQEARQYGQYRRKRKRQRQLAGLGL